MSKTDLRHLQLEKLQPGEIIIRSAEIEKRIHALADEIAAVNRNKQLLLVGLLTGAAWVTTDLFTRLHHMGLTDVELSFMKVASYPFGMTSQSEPRVEYDLPVNPAGRVVLIVDDIIDTGKTLKIVEKMLRSKDAKAVDSFVLLDKPDRRVITYQPTYTGFIIPDIWVQGRGMDTGGYGRGDMNIIKGPFTYTEK